MNSETYVSLTHALTFYIAGRLIVHSVVYDEGLIDIYYLERNVKERSDVCKYLDDNVPSTMIGVDLRDDVCSDDSSSCLFMLKTRHLPSFLSIEESCLLISFAL
jgi:hypothetical protein